MARTDQETLSNRQRRDYGPMPKEMGIDYLKRGIRALKVAFVCSVGITTTSPTYAVYREGQQTLTLGRALFLSPHIIRDLFSRSICSA